MKKNWKVLVAITASLVVLSACGSSGKKDSSNSSKDDVTVNITLPSYNDITDAKEVEKRIDEITRKEYGIGVKITYIPAGNWTDQSNLLLTSDETDILAVMNTPLASYVKNNQLLDLTDFYNNSSDEFKSTISEKEIQGTTINNKIYAITNFRDFGGFQGLSVDEKIGKEYGLPTDRNLTFEDVDNFLAWCKEKYPDKYPLVPQSGNTMTIGWSWDGLGDSKRIGVLPNQGQTTTVQNLYDTDEFKDFCNAVRKWNQKGYVLPDVLSNTEAGSTLVQNGKGISYFENYALSKVDGIEHYNILDAWTVANSYSELCYGINGLSSHPEESWKIMEALRTNDEVIRLLNNGIEGKNYNLNSDGTAVFPDGKTAMDNGYGVIEVYWATPYSEKAIPLEKNGADFFENLKDFNDSTIKSKAIGFSFDIEEVKDQYTACSNIVDKYTTSLLSGSVDIQSTIEQANKELEAAGIEDVIKAKQSQLNEFLKNK